MGRVAILAALAACTARTSFLPASDATHGDPPRGDANRGDALHGDAPGGDPLTGDRERVGWWDSAWQWRQPLTVQPGEIPLPVVLDPSTFDYGRAQPDGRDLRFVDAADNELGYEIEAWQPGGESVVWLLAPLGAEVWLYYGNSGASPVTHSIWNDFEGVWHLNADARDSGPSGFHGTSQGSSNIAGAHAGGEWFDGVDDAIDLGGEIDLLRGVSGATLSAWVYPEVLSPEEPHIIGVGRGGGGPTISSRAALVIEPDGSLQGYARSADSDPMQWAATAAGALPLGEWHHVAVVIEFASDTIQPYIDGVAQPLDGSWIGFSQTSTSDTPSGSVAFGAEDDLSDDFYGGRIDEVRISGVARSAAWIAAEYATLTTEVTLGVAESY